MSIRRRNRRARSEATVATPNGASLATSSNGGAGACGGRPKSKSDLAEKDPSTDHQQSLQIVNKAESFNERAVRAAMALLPEARKVECEAVLNRLCAWLAPPTPPQAQAFCAAVGLPACLVKAMRRFRSTPPVAAAACVAAARAAGTPEALVAFTRAGLMEELAALMDRHLGHGGLQNVCLLVLNRIAGDANVVRQAIAIGYVPRILRAMDATQGREVQFNGLNALLLLKAGCRGPREGLAETAMRAKVAYQNDEDLCSVADDVLAMVTPRFKEVLCWHWQGGWCKLGPRCTYAHGPSDLRSGSLC